MKASTGHQTLTLTGLRFDANLGILESEKAAPQPIQVDAELSLGTQPLLPHDDDIHHVLDYRKVRQHHHRRMHGRAREPAGNPDRQAGPPPDAACPACWACASRSPSWKFLTTVKWRSAWRPGSGERTSTDRRSTQQG